MSNIIEKAELYKALEESLRIQSHYAKLLNMYNGGQRLKFDSVLNFVLRLRSLESKAQDDKAKSHS